MHPDTLKVDDITLDDITESTDPKGRVGAERFGASRTFRCYFKTSSRRIIMHLSKHLP